MIREKYFPTIRKTLRKSKRMRINTFIVCSSLYLLFIAVKPINKSINYSVFVIFFPYHKTTTTTTKYTTNFFFYFFFSQVIYTFVRKEKKTIQRQRAIFRVEIWKKNIFNSFLFAKMMTTKRIYRGEKFFLLFLLRFCVCCPQVNLIKWI